MRSLGVLVLLGTVGSLLSPAPADAQRGWEVTPHLGFYIPTGSVVDVDGRDGGSELNMRHQSAGLVGAKLGYSLGHLALQGTVAFTPSAVAVRDASMTEDITATVLLSAARAMYRVRESTAVDEWNVEIGAGAGVISRQGAAWSEFDGTTDLALVLAAEGHYQFEARPPLEFRLGLEDYVTTAWFRDTDLGAVGEGGHHDLVLTLGISMRLGKE